MTGLFHKLAHMLERNFGRVETWWEGERLMVGFRCDTCGKIDGAHEIKRHRS